MYMRIINGYHELSKNLCFIFSFTFHPCQELPLYSFGDQKLQCNENPQSSETGQPTTRS